jgi:hypothetical protein
MVGSVQAIFHNCKNRQSTQKRQARSAQRERTRRLTIIVASAVAAASSRVKAPRLVMLAGWSPRLQPWIGQAKALVGTMIDARLNDARPSAAPCRCLLNTLTNLRERCYRILFSFSFY